MRPSFGRSSLPQLLLSLDCIYSQTSRCTAYLYVLLRLVQSIMADAKHLKLPAGVLFCSDSGAPQDVSHDTFVRRTLPIASPPPNIVNEEQYSRFSQSSRTNSALPEFNSSIASVKPPFSGSATHPRLEQSIVGPVRHGDQFTSNGNSWLFTASSHSRQLARLPAGYLYPELLCLPARSTMLLNLLTSLQPTPAACTRRLQVSTSA